MRGLTPPDGVGRRGRMSVGTRAGAVGYDRRGGRGRFHGPLTGGRTGRVCGIAVVGFTVGGMTGRGPDGGGVGVRPAARIGGRVERGGGLLDAPGEGLAGVDARPPVVGPVVVLVPPAGDGPRCGVVELVAGGGVRVPPGAGRGRRGRQ